jgi:hypothetical protein
LLCKVFTLQPGKLFGVIYTLGDTATQIEYHCCSNYGPSQRAPSDFVGAGDQPVALPHKPSLEPAVTSHFATLTVYQISGFNLRRGF